MTDNTIELLTSKYKYYLEKGNFQAATIVRRRLNRLVIRRESESNFTTRLPTTRSDTDSEEIGDGSTTTRIKKYPLFDPVDRANEINSWWKGED